MTLSLEPSIRARFWAKVLSPTAQLGHHVATCHSMTGWPLNDCRFMVLPCTRNGAAAACSCAGAFIGAMLPCCAWSAHTGAAATASVVHTADRVGRTSFMRVFCNIVLSPRLGQVTLHGSRRMLDRGLRHRA